MALLIPAPQQLPCRVQRLSAPSTPGPNSISRPGRHRLAAAAAAAAALPVRRATARRAQTSQGPDLKFSDSEVMKSLPGFLSVAPAVLPAIRSFAQEHRNDAVVTWITGKRVQVYLSGEKSGPFLDYAKKHEHSAALLSFLEELKSSLAAVAVANGGEASQDIAALVGASEMQVPHTDLLPGQVQVILALTETSSTLVYDPKLPQPSRQEVAKIMGVKPAELSEEGQFGLVYKSFPLVLPVKEVYKNMVESYTLGPFQCGDAVQIRDGIVHAGPGCEDQTDERVVIFMTYRTFRDEHYEFTFQAKLWDWASHPAIPPMVAYQRLQEVYRFGVENGMEIKPWTYYPPESLEACKMLCTTPGLDEMTVELLVEEWREMLYDENVEIVDQDQEKGALLDA